VLLAVDIGNSHISFGLFENHTLRHHWRAATVLSRTADEYWTLFYPWLERTGLTDASWEAIVLCSVVPPTEQAFELFCQQYLGKTPFKIHSHLPLGFKFNVKVPGEVGADRIANVAYAVKHLSLPAVVVDLGTATTFDVISREGQYEGGFILPGVKMAAEALGRGTSKLPSVELVFPKSLIGKNTTECIQSGILYGYTDLIDGLLTRLRKELGEIDVAFTGGLSFLFREKITLPHRYLPNLTLEGIEIVYRDCT